MSQSFIKKPDNGPHSALPDFLREDAPPTCRCDTCGRKSWDPGEPGKACAMPQPSGGRCAGTMRSHGVAVGQEGQQE